jgi:hypothetical protein
MTDAHTIHVQGLGNDDVVDARRRKKAALGQIMHAAVAARFLIDGARDLERAGELCAQIDEDFHGDDGSRESALHVARAAAEEFALTHGAGKGIDGPAGAGLYHIDMAVEVHARSRQAALAARDHVEARPALAVARSALSAHVLERETAPSEPAADEFRARAVGLARRVHRRKANQVASEVDEFLAARLDGGAHSVDELGG